MTTNTRKIEHYNLPNGKDPFAVWLDGLKDIRARAKININIERLKSGNLSNCESAGKGVSELKINYGPGYRVYFGQVGQVLVLLLCGGDKSTQDNDIKTAHAYWDDYKRRSAS